MSELGALAPPVAEVISRPDEFAELFSAIHAQICRVVRGKPQEVRLALVCVFSEGHLLVEDVPGVGKTSLAKAIARSLGLASKRVQFTPDLLPSDLMGSSVFDRSTSSFIFRPGSLFTNVLVADEINRASPKCQAALLEAMEERQVTVDGVTYELPAPFLVVATQNPVEHEGTFPLPVSELDRFLMRLHLGYPDKTAEIAILQGELSCRDADALPAIAPMEKVGALVRFSRTIHIENSLRAYIVELGAATRRHPGVAIGLSPRAVLAVQRASRCMAASLGRRFVTPDDIKAVLGPIGEHRLMLTPELAFTQKTAADVVQDVLASVPVPVPGLVPTA